MVARIANPFGDRDIRCPAAQFEVYERYCIPRPTLAELDLKPFRTFADLWYLGVCVSVCLGLEPIDVSEGRTRRLAPGTFLDQTPWRIPHLQVVARSRADGDEVLIDPARMMNLANGLASVGVAEIHNALRGDDQPPLWALSDALRKWLPRAETTPSGEQVVQPALPQV